MEDAGKAGVDANGQIPIG